jgi:large subunit ribosomal protein L10
MAKTQISDYEPKINDTKSRAVDNVKEIFGKSTDFIFTEYRGLTVEQITDLRRQLRAKEAIYKVIKNDYARIAFKERNAPDVSAYLCGPTAIAVASKDSNEVAKILLKFKADVPNFVVKGGLVGTSIYDADQIEAFSKLPGRLELISMLMSVMNGSTRNLVGALNDIPSRLVRTVKAIADKKAAASSEAVVS